MKLSKNLFFALTLLVFGCKGADGGSCPEDVWLKGRKVVKQAVRPDISHIIEQSDYDFLKAHGIVNEQDTIIDNEQFYEYLQEKAKATQY